jgi:hypothetical protein
MTKVLWIALQREKRSEIGSFFYAQMCASLENPTFGRIAMAGMKWQ